jgi:hypothetical protein
MSDAVQPGLMFPLQSNVEQVDRLAEPLAIQVHFLSASRLAVEEGPLSPTGWS